jgi:hypothetical protein|tara:strand:+ start:802 stop:993 length:192 start_codon:yes stop_codon:yes gene_type:complete
VEKAQHSVEIDTTKAGVLVLDGNRYPVDGEVVEFITDMMEELKDLRDKVHVYENEIIIVQGEA